jgi:hypothetical protein
MRVNQGYLCCRPQTATMCPRHTNHSHKFEDLEPESQGSGAHEHRIGDQKETPQRHPPSSDQADVRSGRAFRAAEGVLPSSKVQRAWRNEHFPCREAKTCLQEIKPSCYQD